ncbi:hypothetical protein HDU97_008727 [Phlyctochytrium planicorne]|nr:hypothetical protein HDU97_008727 [Phlyctochytrium planicorne]
MGGSTATALPESASILPVTLTSKVLVAMSTDGLIPSEGEGKGTASMGSTLKRQKRKPVEYKPPPPLPPLVQTSTATPSSAVAASLEASSPYMAPQPPPTKTSLFASFIDRATHPNHPRSYTECSVGSVGGSSTSFSHPPPPPVPLHIRIASSPMHPHRDSLSRGRRLTTGDVDVGTGKAGGRWGEIMGVKSVKGWNLSKFNISSISPFSGDANGMEAYGPPINSSDAASGRMRSRSLHMSLKSFGKRNRTQSGGLGLASSSGSGAVPPVPSHQRHRIDDRTDDFKRNLIGGKDTGSSGVSLASSEEYGKENASWGGSMLTARPERVPLGPRTSASIELVRSSYSSLNRSNGPLNLNGPRTMQNASASPGYNYNSMPRNLAPAAPSSSVSSYTSSSSASSYPAYSSAIDAEFVQAAASSSLDASHSVLSEDATTTHSTRATTGAPTDAAIVAMAGYLPAEIDTDESESLKSVVDDLSKKVAALTAECEELRKERGHGPLSIDTAAGVSMKRSGGLVAFERTGGMVGDVMFGADQAANVQMDNLSEFPTIPEDIVRQEPAAHLPVPPPRAPRIDLLRERFKEVEREIRTAPLQHHHHHHHHHHRVHKSQNGNQFQQQPQGGHEGVMLQSGKHCPSCSSTLSSISSSDSSSVVSALSMSTAVTASQMGVGGSSLMAAPVVPPLKNSSLHRSGYRFLPMQTQQQQQQQQQQQNYQQHNQQLTSRIITNAMEESGAVMATFHPSHAAPTIQPITGVTGRRTGVALPQPPVSQLQQTPAVEELQQIQPVVGLEFQHVVENISAAETNDHNASEDDHQHHQQQPITTTGLKRLNRTTRPPPPPPPPPASTISADQTMATTETLLEGSSQPEPRSLPGGMVGAGDE